MAENELRWLEIGKAIERACRELPNGADLTIELEKGYGGARLRIDSGSDAPDYDNDEWLGDEFATQINNAIDYAIESAKTQGNAA